MIHAFAKSMQVVGMIINITLNPRTKKISKQIFFFLDIDTEQINYTVKMFKENKAKLWQKWFYFTDCSTFKNLAIVIWQNIA